MTILCPRPCSAAEQGPRHLHPYERKSIEGSSGILPSDGQLWKCRYCDLVWVQRGKALEKLGTQKNFMLDRSNVK